MYSSRAKIVNTVCGWFLSRYVRQLNEVNGVDNEKDFSNINNCQSRMQMCFKITIL